MVKYMFIKTIFKLDSTVIGDLEICFPESESP